MVGPADSERSADGAFLLGCEPGDALCLVDGLFGLTDDLLADGGGRDLFVRAFEDPHAEFALQLHEQGAQGGLGDVEMLGRPRETAITVDRCDVFELL